MKLTRIHKFIEREFRVNFSSKSSKGWMMSPNECPWCGKGDEHLGIRFNTPTAKYNNHISFHCFKCDEKGGEFKLLRAIGQANIIKDGEYIDHSKKLEKRVVVMDVDHSKKINLKSPKRIAPIGFKRIDYCDYLDSRGFEPWQYELYNVGKTSLDYRLKDYVIFLIKEKGIIKGNVSRSIKSKEWIKSFNENVKTFNKKRPPGEKKKLKYLRYRNDEAEFDKLLMGIDEVNKGTKVAILVEGIMDKANVDKLLKLNLDSSVKCLCTFGKKISDEQILKLREWGLNISTIILIYDPDAVEDSKTEGYRLKQVFKKVLIGFTSENDPGDVDLEELNYIIDTAEPPLNFKINKIQKKKLR